MTKRKTKKGRSGRPLMWAGSIVVVALGGIAGWGYMQSQPAGEVDKPLKVKIEPRSSAHDIAWLLEHKGVIRNGRIFLWMANWRGDANRFRAGTYKLSPTMRPATIMELLKRGGEADENRVTIPEGFTLRQIAERLANRKIVKSADEFLQIVEAKKPSLNAPFALPENGLEGYLFPDTYEFAPGTRAEVVAQKLLDTFTSQFYTPNLEAIRKSRHSLHELVTIASMVEREAVVEGDRAKVAGVIENRLAKGMRLQIDATVLYALGYHKTRVLLKDLEVKSPYNTYRNSGLPPGAISAPGRPSLIAALNPEKSDYLYYVLNRTGAHTFSRTESEHAVAVKQYRAFQAEK